MNRLTAVLLVGATMLGASSASASSPPTDTDVRASFLAWIDASGLDLRGVACAVEDATAWCYGLAGTYVIAGTAPVDGEPLAWAQLASTVEPTPPPATTATTLPAANTPAGPAASFSDGNWIVGTDVVVGTYTMTINNPEPNCWVETFTDLTGNDSIDYIYAEVPGTYFFEVPADAAIVNSDECGTWTLVE